MDENTVKARQTVEAQLIGRALQDDAFRQELVRDPRGVFARELGIGMPEHLQVQVLEESPSTVYLVLPPPVASVGSELSDTELEAVAGGWEPTNGAECSVCAGGATESCCFSPRPAT